MSTQIRHLHVKLNLPEQDILELWDFKLKHYVARNPQTAHSAFEEFSEGMRCKNIFLSRCYHEGKLTGFLKYKVSILHGIVISVLYLYKKQVGKNDR